MSAPTDGERVASLDVGSNTILMLIAERRGGVWHKVEDHHAITRVAEGLDQRGTLAEHAVVRTAEALAEFGAIGRRAGAARWIATGTAPFRRASNGPEVAQRLSESLGATIDVISGELEAELAFVASERSFPDLPLKVVVDIGGASTEVIVSDGSTRETVSLDIGSVRLTERCVRNAPLLAEDRARLQEAVWGQLDRPDVRALRDRFASLNASGDGALIGIAGTVTTVATVAQAMDVYDDERVHGSRLELVAVWRAFEEVASRSIERRGEVVGLPAKRADVFPAGSFLLASLLEAFKLPALVVSDRGIRWGRLYQEWP